MRKVCSASKLVFGLAEACKPIFLARNVRALCSKILKFIDRFLDRNAVGRPWHIVQVFFQILFD